MSAVTTHAMTIDVEDYYQVSALAEKVKPEDWNNWPSRVVENTERILSLFEKKGVKGTFFILGWVAEREPELVKTIAAAGHEIASHGYSHQLVYKQTPAVFEEETRKSKTILEDLAQTPVLGYRAASYSITGESLWALDILGELGFIWDSSIFPVSHDRYGMPGTPLGPYEITTSKGHKIREFPLTVAKLFGFSVPAAGGGYFRQYPYFLSRWLFNYAGQKQQLPQIFYLHPWEVDPDQPVVEGLSWLSRFRHYTNLDKCFGRMEQLLSDFKFDTMTESFKLVENEKSLQFDTQATA